MEPGKSDGYGAWVSAGGRSASTRRRLLRGEGLLLDLSSHLREISTPPPVPAGWQVETALVAAGGAEIGGDFVVFDLAADAKRLSAVLVDTSGKGFAAATRSLMLAGAVSGLLGSVPTSDLLDRLNAHIHRRHNWEEHFATAAHVEVDLTTGAYQLGVGGHVPPAIFHAGRGVWQLCEVGGAGLGFNPGGQWPYVSGVLDPGDAILLVTDGVIERRGEDLASGYDRLLGGAERLITSGFRDAADTLLASRPPHGDDDAAVVFIHRQP